MLKNGDVNQYYSGKKKSGKGDGKKQFLEMAWAAPKELNIRTRIKNSVKLTWFGHELQFPFSPLR